MASRNGIKQKIWIQAQLLGETRFYLPIPCANGHNTYFYVSNGHCSACQNDDMKAKRARWYKEGLNNRGKPRMRA